MATTEHADAAEPRQRVAVYVLLGLLAVAAVVAVIVYRSSPPQMGTSEEAFNTVDALYTAVRNRDEKRLSECEQRLKAHRAAGKLPPDAADALDAIIAKARAGSWDAATERLYDFMRAQRREGDMPPAPHKPPRKGAK